MEAGGRVGCWTGRVAVSVRVSDKVKVTLCKAPLKHENNKDGMSFTPHGFTWVKSFSFHFPISEVDSECCNTCLRLKDKVLTGGNRFLELIRNQVWNL